MSRFIAATSRCSSSASVRAHLARRSPDRRTVAAASLHAAVGLPAALVQLADQLQPRVEQPLAERLAERALGGRQVLAEELQVLAVVEEVEELLVLPGPEQVRAQPRAAADHLPELGLRAHQLEEHQVHDLRHVDAGVEHVHRDRDVRRLVLAREVVDQALRVLGLERDDARELALVVRIVGVEALGDELGVLLVLGEEDRLAEPVAARDLDARASSGAPAPCRRCPC